MRRVSTRRVLLLGRVWVVWWWIRLLCSCRVRWISNVRRLNGSRSSGVNSNNRLGRLGRGVVDVRVGPT